MIFSREWGTVPPKDKLFKSRHLKPGDTVVLKRTGELLAVKLYFKGTGALRAWGLPDEPLMLDDVQKCRVLPLRDVPRIKAALDAGLHFSEPRAKVPALLDVLYRGTVFTLQAALEHESTPAIAEALRRRGWLVVSPRQALEFAELKRRGL